MLGNISNPQVADIAGALNYRQQQIEQERKRLEQQEIGRLVAQAIPGLSKDSPLRAIAEKDVDTFALLAKTLDIPINEGARFQQFADRVGRLSAMANTEPRDAYNYAKEIQADNQQKGIQDKKLDEWVGLVESDPVTAFNSLFVMNESLNPPKAKEGFTLGEGQTRFDAQGNPIASVKKTYDPNSPESQPTANAKDWATYQSLLAKGDKAGAEQFGRAAGFVSSEGQKLSSHAEKLISEAGDAYNSANSASSRYSALADKLEKAKMSGGLSSTWGEFVKEQSGNQDELTALRKEALAISNSEAIANLPPGPATDRDIELAKAPFPTEKADPKYVANWLRAVSNLQRKKAEYESFKADFVSKNGSVRDKDGNSLISAWRSQNQSSAEPQQKKPASSVGRFKIEVHD